MVAYGIVYAPNQPDAHGDSADAGTIRAAAYGFMREARLKNIDAEHSFAPEQAFVAESWLTRPGDPVFPNETPGAWAVGIQIADPDLWQQLKRRELTGISLAGFASIEEDTTETAKDESGTDHLDGWAKRLSQSLAKSFGQLLSPHHGHHHNGSQQTYTEEEKDPCSMTEEDIRALVADMVRETVKTEIAAALAEALPQRPAETVTKSDVTAIVKAELTPAVDKLGEDLGRSVDTAIAKALTGGATETFDGIELQNKTKTQKEGAVAKGVISAADLSVGGELAPEAARGFINAVIDQNDFLQKVTTYQTARLTREINVLEIAKRVLVRTNEGTAPRDDQKAGATNTGSYLTLLDVDLYPFLGLSAIRDEGDNPDFVQQVQDGFAIQVGNDLVDLGWNGTDDDYAGEEFLKLNKGWVQIADDHADVAKPLITPSVDGWRVALQTVRDAADRRFMRDPVFIMNEADADAYHDEVGQHVTGYAHEEGSPGRRFNGRPIIAEPDFPQGYVMMTPLKNLVFGVHKRVVKSQGFEPTRKGIQFTFNMAVDYEIAVKRAAGQLSDLEDGLGPLPPSPVPLPPLAGEGGLLDLAQDTADETVEPVIVAVTDLTEPVTEVTDPVPGSVTDPVTEETVEPLIGQIARTVTEDVAGDDGLIDQVTDETDELLVPAALLEEHLDVAIRAVKADTGFDTAPSGFEGDWDEAVKIYAICSVFPWLNTFALDGAARVGRLEGAIEARFLDADDTEGRIALLKDRFTDLVRRIRQDSGEGGDLELGDPPDDGGSGDSEIGSVYMAKAVALLPDALGSIWSDSDGLVVYMAGVTFGPAIGHEDGWALQANFAGEVRAEFRADEIDDLPVEALVSDLIGSPLVFAADDGLPDGALSEQARVKLTSLQHELHDQWVVGVLTFDLQGRIVERQIAPDTPDGVFVNDCPPSRQDPGPIEDYRPIEEVGRIEQADYANATARVQLDDTLTDWLPMLAPRAGNDRVWFPYDVGEQVLVLSPSGDLSQGVILGSLYADAAPQNGTTPELTRIDFADGSFLQHDTASGDALISIRGNLTIETDGDLCLNVGGHFSLKGLAHVKQSIADILTTPIGSRVMRRDYGSDLFRLIDDPINDVTLIRIYAATAEAIRKWEPRVRVNRVQARPAVDEQSQGCLTIDLEIEYLPDGRALTLEGLIV
ncbi:xkdF [Symbiodinium microadriaticum]|nr:xkdF [Symbiodinium microadriaticum]